MDTEVLMVPEEKPKSQPPSPRASTVPNSVPNESSTKEPEPPAAELPVEGDDDYFIPNFTSPPCSICVFSRYER